MPMIAKVRTHTISKNVTLSTSGYNLVGAGSPAIEAMTDFLRVNLVTIGASESLVDANARMISRGVRMLIVSAPDDGVLGLITARDIMGEKPMQLAQARGCKRGDLQVVALAAARLGDLQRLFAQDVAGGDQAKHRIVRAAHHQQADAPRNHARIRFDDRIVGTNHHDVDAQEIGHRLNGGRTGPDQVVAGSTQGSVSGNLVRTHFCCKGHVSFLHRVDG